MKNVFGIGNVCLVALSFLFLFSCGTNKVVSVSQQGSKSPFGETYEAPCSEYDTEEYFAATGISSGPSTRMDVLQTSALTNAQNIIRQKMQHAYRGAIDDYSNYIGTNAGSDADVKVERAGIQIIDDIINDTQSRCLKFSSVDEKGNVTCFVGIRISKKETADRISDFVSADDELKIRFKEENFRKKMDESFRKYKENQ